MADLIRCHACAASARAGNALAEQHGDTAGLLVSSYRRR